MRNISLVSIILALAIGAVAWQQMSRYILPGRSGDVTDIETHAERTVNGNGTTDGECDQMGDGTISCPDTEGLTEQEEVEQRRRDAYGDMMKSFDTEMDRYRRQTGGRP